MANANNVKVDTKELPCRWFKVIEWPFVYHFQMVYTIVQDVLSNTGSNLFRKKILRTVSTKEFMKPLIKNSMMYFISNFASTNYQIILLFFSLLVRKNLIFNSRIIRML